MEIVCLTTLTQVTCYPPCTPNNQTQFNCLMVIFCYCMLMKLAVPAEVCKKQSSYFINLILILKTCTVHHSMKSCCHHGVFGLIPEAASSKLNIMSILLNLGLLVLAGMVHTPSIYAALGSI